MTHPSRLLHRRLVLLAAVLFAGSALGGCSGRAYVKPRPLKPGMTFTGIWDSNWGEMRLTQNGKRVIGTFQYRNGQIAGTLDGDVLHFKWKQAESRYAGTGSGYLQMSPDGNRLEGRWGYNDDEVEGGKWWAERADPSSSQFDKDKEEKRE